MSYQGGTYETVDSRVVTYWTDITFQSGTITPEISDTTGSIYFTQPFENVPKIFLTGFTNTDTFIIMKISAKTTRHFTWISSGIGLTSIDWFAIQ
jgi:hypothetical protein